MQKRSGLYLAGEELAPVFQAQGALTDIPPILVFFSQLLMLETFFSKSLVLHLLLMFPR